jgi:hypothetical protein
MRKVSSEKSDEIGTIEAAEILGLTRGRVAQLATEIGGKLFLGRLVFSRAKVIEFKKKPRSPGWKKGKSRKEKD